MQNDLILMHVHQKVVRTIHVMMKYDGVGLSEDKLKQLNKNGVKVIRTIYLSNEGTKIYISTLKQFLTSDKRELNPLIKNDYQRFVSFRDMIEE